MSDTMTTDEVMEITQEVCEALEDVDVQAESYKRGPVAKSVFSAGIDKNVVKLWTGFADVDLHPSRRHNQAVVTAIEASRVIERTLNLGRVAKSMQDSQVRRTARARFPVVLPTNTKYTTKVFRTDERTDKDYYGERTYATQQVNAQVKATVPASEVSLLVGWDETSQFIAALPMVASSVKEAHDLLRGDVPDNAKRQGEWFFIPATPEEEEKIWAKLARSGPARLRGGWWGGALESGSSHVAPCRVNVDNLRYTMGVVADTRRGHHAPLILKTWHRIVRNREVISNNAMRRRTWD